MRRKMKKELFELKSKNAIRGLKETHKIWDTKVKIARINTLLALKIKEKYGNNMK
jgi:ribosomal protein L29